MKANEFVKKFGIVKAGKVVIGHPKAAVYKFYNYDFEKEYGEHDEVCLADLKRLVESHELVENWDGLNGAINSLGLLECSLAIGLYHGVVGVNAEAQISELKQAIADVESCMEVSSESN